MQIEQTNNHYSPCPTCFSRGKVAPKQSKKKRMAYGAEENATTEEEHALITRYINICTNCNGSGLLPADQVTPINTDYPHVAIIGAGIGGVALAVALQHRGIPFTLYEKDDSFDARSQGYGLTLQQASNAMAGLGINDLPGGITSTKHVVHNTDGKIIGEWGLRKWVQNPTKNTKRKNIHISRQSLRKTLLNQLDTSNPVQWSHNLINFTEDNNGKTTIEFQKNDEIITVQANLIVGADGIYSSVRKQLISDDQTPLQYLGCIVVLGICPLDSIKDTNSPLLDSETVFQTVNGTERIYMMPYDKNTIMWQLSFPMSENDAKQLSIQGSDVMKTQVIARLSKWHSPIPQILNMTDVSRITGYPVYDRKILDLRLLSTAGNATVIGDAAHPMSPFKGQGANQALLDALALAREIYITCSTESEWYKHGIRKVLLSHCEKEMIDRTASKVIGSAKAVELLHSESVLHEGDEPRGRGI